MGGMPAAPVTPTSEQRPSPSSGGRQSAPLAWSVPVTALLAAVVVVVPVAALSGAVAPLVLGDAGPLVRWGMVLLKAVHHVSMALTIGLLVVAAFLVREGPTTRRREIAGRLAAQSGILWLLSALGILVLGFGDLAGLRPGAPGYLDDLLANLWTLELMRLRVVEVLLVAALIPLAALARTRAALAWASVLALVATVPLAFGGHSASNVGHETAVTALNLHLVGVSVWVGGLMAVALLLPILGPALHDTVRRFSTLALWSFVAVAFSGVLFATLTADDLGDLTSPYWRIIWAKIAILGVLGVLGAAQRRVLLARGVDTGGAFARLAGGELLLMGAAIGLGAALSRTAPPGLQGIDASDPAYALTKYPMPPPFEPARLLDTWAINWICLIVAVLAVGLYVAGMAKLRRRGDRWPAWRLLVWVIAWAIFVYVTSGAPAVYGRVIFSHHMVMHMGLMMAVPVFLVPAQSITLAYRTLPARKDKTLGPREILVGVLDSGWARLMVNPLVAGANFFLSLVLFYWTGLLEWALTSHLGHLFMIFHFTLTGFAFVWSLAGQDPGPPKWEPPMRMLVAIGTLAAHAFFGLSIMQGTWLLAPGFFKTVDVPWVDDLLYDQQIGGAIAWGIGEIPTLIVVLMITLGWMRTDARETKRYDRQAARDGDAELAAYNARLQALDERSHR